MASLFSDLPAAKRAASAEQEESPAKKARTDDAGAESAPGVEYAPPLPQAAQASASEPAGAPQDQVRAALVRIAQHISHPKKFAKASPLLRELLSGGKVQPEHSKLLFEALRLSMVDPDASAQPALRREYSKLFTLASKHSHLFTSRERSQLDVYGVWAVFRSQLSTDDSFAFNKVLSKLKQQVAELPEAEAGEDELYAALQAAERGATAAGSDVLQREAAPAAPKGPAEAPELDPFGLSGLMEQQAAAEAADARKRRSATTAWTPAQALAARRQALLDCLAAAWGQYHHAWARTSVDLLIQEAATQRRMQFTPGQRKELDVLHNLVKKARAERTSGPSAREQRRDMTSFEAARVQWSKADVSARGKVGAGGDHRTEAWLG